VPYASAFPRLGTENVSIQEDVEKYIGRYHRGPTRFVEPAVSILNFQPLEIIIGIHGKGGRSIKNEKF
jgi:hypothetical protein